MGTDGTYGERLLNSYLEGAEVFTWHETLGLGAFVEHGPETSSPTMQERYIAVTNLGGSYYHRFTEGPYDDQLPTWGPGGGVLLFRRQDVNMGWELPTRIMKINLRTEEIEQLVEPKTVDGSTYHSWPHYQY